MKVSEFDYAVDFTGGWIADCRADRRIHIHFDHAPEPGIVARLNAAGFQRTQYTGHVWERRTSLAAKYSAARLTGADWSKRYRLDDKIDLDPEIAAALRHVLRSRRVGHPVTALPAAVRVTPRRAPRARI